MRTIKKVVIEKGDAMWERLCMVRQQEIADHMGVTPACVSQWKIGRLMLKWDEYMKLCEYLGVEVSNG